MVVLKLKNCDLKTAIIETIGDIPQVILSSIFFKKVEKLGLKVPYKIERYKKSKTKMESEN